MKYRQLSQLADEPSSHNSEIRKKVMLRNGELGRITNFAQARFPPGQIAAAHAHQDMIEVFYVQEGAGEMWVDGVARGLETGACVAVEPGETHEIRNTGDAELVLVYFGLLAE